MQYGITHIKEMIFGAMDLVLLSSFYVLEVVSVARGGRGESVLNCGFLPVELCLYICFWRLRGRSEASACTHTHSAGLFCFCEGSSPNRAFLKDVTMAGNSLTTMKKVSIICLVGFYNDYNYSCYSSITIITND